MKKRFENVLLGICMVLLITTAIVKNQHAMASETEIRPINTETPVVYAFEFPQLATIPMLAELSDTGTDQPDFSSVTATNDAGCTSKTGQLFKPAIRLMNRNALPANDDPDWRISDHDFATTKNSTENQQPATEGVLLISSHDRHGG